MLSEGKGVCQAYALVLYRMLDMLGFEVQYVPGKVGEQLHAWVLVKLDNEWYHIDVTWDDPLPDRKGEVRYNYFLVSDQQLAKDHTWDFASFPSATSEKYAGWQEQSRIEVLTQPLANLFTPNSGLTIIENNALQMKQLIEHSAQLPNDFQLSDKLNQIVLYEQQDKVVLQSALTVRPVIVKTKINGDARIMRLLRFDKNEKRMPQEKYVIIKEVSLMHYGAPPSSS
ncbi:hypothetical protein LYSIN_00020 [Lysinibacillus sphaericus]|uniref:Transglutaminase-like domain-containing protein n=1 Tax=Lysinibacillus sphaericus TaxID=1421 RepID=A0A2S5CWU9_LYSSH|nr:hypothetical protein LYSIN_00020 [Lysinibacillus sphaericus]